MPQYNIQQILMEKIIKSQLKSEIQLTLRQISQENSQLLFWLEDLNQSQMSSFPHLPPKLQIVKNQIKDKIKSLTSNYEQIYKLMDHKISLVVRALKDHYSDKPMQEAKEKIAELERKISTLEEKDKENQEYLQQLKKRNSVLAGELEEMLTKVKDTETDISNKKINVSAEKTKSKKGSVLQSPRFLNQSSRQCSFSSALAQQKSELNVVKEKNHFRFGCLPFTTREQSSGQMLENGSINHRMEFLVTNLGEQTENKKNSQSWQEKSVFSNMVTRKYQ